MRAGLLPAGLAAVGYALLELAFFVRRNLLLPWEAEHVTLGILFVVVHGAIAGVTLVVTSRWSGRGSSLLGRSLPRFAPTGVLAAIHLVSHYRERVNSRPRDLEGTLVTLGLVVGVALVTFAVAWALRGSARRGGAVASALGAGIVALGIWQVVAVQPVGGAMPVTPRPAGESLEADDTGQRVFILGFDGATWDVLDPLLAAGRLPNLAALIARGRTFRLETIRPTFSPVIWTSVATGKDRFQHGIHDVVQTRLPGGATLRRSMDRTAFLTKSASRFLHFLHRRGLTRLTPYRSDQVAATSVFEAASEAGLSTSRVEWYVTWPARPLTGVNVSDRFHLQDPTGSPKADVVAPATLAPLLLEHVVAPEDVPVERILSLVDTEGMSEAEVRRWADDHTKFVTEMRYSLARDLTTRNVAVDLLSRDDEWRLFGVYFRAVDLSHHLTWSRRNAPGDPARDPDLRLRTVVDRGHELLDGIVGEVLARVPPDAVVVMLSDHGFEDRYAHARAPEGFAILAGEVVAPAPPGSARATIGVYEIAPTVAALLGLPVADDLVAAPRTDLLDPGFVASHPVRAVRTWERAGRWSAGPTAAEDRSVEEAELERLRALGYIQ